MFTKGNGAQWEENKEDTGPFPLLVNSKTLGMDLRKRKCPTGPNKVDFLYLNLHAQPEVQPALNFPLFPCGEIKLRAPRVDY